MAPHVLGIYLAGVCLQVLRPARLQHCPHPLDGIEGRAPSWQVQQLQAVLLGEPPEHQRVVCCVVVEDEETLVGAVVFLEQRHELEERLRVGVRGELPAEGLAHVRAEGPYDGVARAPT